MPLHVQSWHRRPAGLAVFAAWLCAASCAHAQDEAPIDPELLFERMAAATRSLNYDGVFVNTRGERADSMRIIHRADAGGEQERIISLSGPAREVIRDNQTVTCLFPDSRSVMVEKTTPHKFLPVLNHPPAEIARSYQFVLLGRDRTAGRPTWVIGVLPRSAWRYGYRFWIDSENHLMLRSEVVNSRGTILEQIVFTQISSPASIPDELLQSSIEGETFTRLDRSAAVQEPNEAVPAVENWKVQWVPEGFSLRQYRVQRLSASDQPVEHIVYSDGLAMISVFVEKLSVGTESLQGFSAIGAVNTFSMVRNDHQVTVVGEVPPLTVRQVAGSVARQPSGTEENE